MITTWPDDDNHPPIPLGQLVHAQDCPGPRITRRDAIGFAAVSCAGCGAHARLPLRREWQAASGH